MYIRGMTKKENNKNNKENTIITPHDLTTSQVGVYKLCIPYVELVCLKTIERIGFVKLYAISFSVMT